MADGESERSKTTRFLAFISCVKNNNKCLNSIVKLLLYFCKLRFEYHVHSFKRKDNKKTKDTFPKITNLRPSEI